MFSVKNKKRQWLIGVLFLMKMKRRSVFIFWEMEIGLDLVSERNWMKEKVGRRLKVRGRDIHDICRVYERL